MVSDKTSPAFTPLALCHSPVAHHMENRVERKRCTQSAPPASLSNTSAMHSLCSKAHRYVYGVRKWVQPLTASGELPRAASCLFVRSMARGHMNAIPFCIALHGVILTIYVPCAALM